MRVPERLEPLLDLGVIEAVLRPLMSGKEAEVYLVRAGGEECVAKVYKDARFRSFQHRAGYIEGRRVRSSREQRAMDNKSQHGRQATETTTAEQACHGRRGATTSERDPGGAPPPSRRGPGRGSPRRRGPETPSLAATAAASGGPVRGRHGFDVIGWLTGDVLRWVREDRRVRPPRPGSAGR